MKKSTRLASVAGLLAAAAHPLVMAHVGHGMPGISHWHAADTVVVVLLVAAAFGALAWWRGRP